MRLSGTVTSLFCGTHGQAASVSLSSWNSRMQGLLSWSWLNEEGGWESWVGATQLCFCGLSTHISTPGKGENIHFSSKQSWAQIPTLFLTGSVMSLSLRLLS